MKHPKVEQVAVIVREDQPGDKRLVSYIVASNNEMIDTNEMRRYAGGVYQITWFHMLL